MNAVGTVQTVIPQTFGTAMYALLAAMTVNVFFGRAVKTVVPIRR
jgi:hypothetical protein